MRPSDIAAIALVDGTLYAVAGELVARLGAAGFHPVATVGGGRLTSVARYGDALLVADAGNNRIWRVTPAGLLAPFAGALQPAALDARARSVDGPAASALLRAPHAVAVLDDETVAFLEPRDGRPVMRTISGGSVTTVELSGLPVRNATAVAPSHEGLLLVDGATPTPCLMEASLDGTVRLVAGSVREPGSEDGPLATARFARPLALAAGPERSYVADGARIRAVDDLVVTTVAGGPPGDEDGDALSARFALVTALAASPDGALVAVDGGNESIRRLEGGRVVTLYRHASAPGATAALVDEIEARALARELGAAIVDGDFTTAEEVVERLLADHRARGDARPNRLIQPVSVASARVGRALALEWALAADPRRSRLGAYCLWLVRSAEGRDAPRSDADNLATALASAIDMGALDRAATIAAAMRLVFGPRRRRDRRAAARAVTGAGLEASCRALLASDDPAARRLGLRVAELGRDIRLTPAIAPFVLDGDPDAAGAVSAIWAAPCYTLEQERALRESLPFTQPALERLARHPSLDPGARRRLRDFLRRGPRAPLPESPASRAES
jgi:hypothetical protein